MKRLVSAGLWLAGLASLSLGVLFVFLGSGLQSGGFAVTVLASSGFIVSGLLLCGVGAILDVLIERL